MPATLVAKRMNSDSTLSAIIRFILIIPSYTNACIPALLFAILCRLGFEHSLRYYGSSLASINLRNFALAPIHPFNSLSLTCLRVGSPIMSAKCRMITHP